MEQVKVTVRCGNPYYRGELRGVQFEQAKGGAVGSATLAQARQIVRGEPGFTCAELADQPPDILDLKGVGAKTAEKLAEAGITTIEQLAAAPTKELAEKLGEPVEKVVDWQAQIMNLEED